MKTKSFYFNQSIMLLTFINALVLDKIQFTYKVNKDGKHAVTVKDTEPVLTALAEQYELLF